jgi:predicted CoA-substrate-specific enzyme activase
VGDNYEITLECKEFPEGEIVDAAVGVDVGSISTNVVVIDTEGNVLSRRYLMTAGRPLEAVKRGLYEVGQEVGDKVRVMACGTTGSGRYLTGDFIGADVVKNEITAHATGAIHFDPEVDTIFEIGGQDSKYVSLDHGAIVDFTMNKVCAAGTGSFLEEQAERLGIKIEEEFGKTALSAANPVLLGERCTVFMESDLNHHQQQGARKDNLVAGLCYSIVFNYLNKVVEDRRVGDRIFFQGGVTANRGVKAAFESVTGKKIIVPPHHDVLGAIGVALVALKENAGKESTFKGFDQRGKEYEMTSFNCSDCPNMCQVRRVEIKGEGSLYYGSRCGKYDEKKKVSKGAHLPRLFREREEMLLTSYPNDDPEKPNGKTVGIPQIAIFFEFYPMWKAFFTELGFKVVLSDPTNRRIIDAGLATVASETCFPIKVAHGHVLNLLDKKVDYIFLPSVINMTHESDKIVHSYSCPYVQCTPYLIKAAVTVEDPRVTILDPVIHLERGKKHLRRMMKQLARGLGCSSREVAKAVDVACEAQDKFYADLQRRPGAGDGQPPLQRMRPAAEPEHT